MIKTQHCASCASPNYLGWTAGNKADGDRLARELTAGKPFDAEVVPCRAYGYDVVRVTR